MQSYHGQHRIGARCFREARLAANFSAAAKPVLWLSYNLQHTRAVARAVDSCSTKAMKVVIALALPAAALTASLSLRTDSRSRCSRWRWIRNFSACAVSKTDLFARLVNAHLPLRVEVGAAGCERVAGVREGRGASGERA